MEEKNVAIYGCSNDELEKIAEKYCKVDHCHTVNSPLAPQKSYWESLKEGCDGLLNEVDILELI